MPNKDQLFLPFTKARLHTRSLTLKDREEWPAWCVSSAPPANIPSNPHTTCRHDGWQGHGHWLGTGNLRTKDFVPFKKALLYARSLKLKTNTEWRQWCKSGACPANILSSPGQSYKYEGWQGCGHWLGTVAVAPKDHQFLPLEKALLQARCLKIKGQVEVHGR